MITFLDPSTVAAPAGAYSHSAVVPPGSTLVFISGQVGAAPDGRVPSTLAGQAEQVFANIGAILAAHGLGPRDLVKLTMFIVAGQDVATIRAARTKLLDDHRPTSSAVFVSRLLDPAWLIEVEAVAARTPESTAGADRGSPVGRG